MAIYKYEDEILDLITEEEAQEIIDNYPIAETIVDRMYEIGRNIYMDLRDGEMWYCNGDYNDYYSSSFIIRVAFIAAYRELPSYYQIINDCYWNEFMEFEKEYEEWLEWDEEDEKDDEDRQFSYDFAEGNRYNMQETFCNMVLKQETNELERENFLENCECGYELEGFLSDELDDFYEKAVTVPISYKLENNDELIVNIDNEVDTDDDSFYINIPLSKDEDGDEELLVIGDKKCLEAINSDEGQGVYVVIALEYSNNYNIKIGDLIAIEKKADCQTEAILTELLAKYERRES